MVLSISGKPGRLYIGLGVVVVGILLIVSLMLFGQTSPQSAGKPPAQSAPPSKASESGPTPATAAAKEATGLLEKNTIFGVYGRAFGRAPILGHLGTYKNFDMMAADIPKWVDEIQKHNDNKQVIPAVHLIYALAIPCTEKKDDCLQYLEGPTSLIIDNYIKPAAERGWLIFLDTQLGKSNPVAQVNRMIEKGYLKFENVHVAIDPEFHLYPNRKTPGIPIGTVEASEINDAQKILDDYVRSQGLKTKKVLIVHQFGDANIRDGVPFMIEHKKDLKSFTNVQLVIDADGLGAPEIKVVKYNKMTDAKVYPFINYRGIKVFYPNQWEKAGHFDKPPMTIDQVFGIEPVVGRLKMAAKPSVVIIA